MTEFVARGGGHEREISNAGREKLDFAEIGQCKPVLLGLSLAGNLVKPLLSLYGTEWRERGYGLWSELVRAEGITTTTNTVGWAWDIVHSNVHCMWLAACRMSWITSCSRQLLTNSARRNKTRQ